MHGMMMFTRLSRKDETDGHRDQNLKSDFARVLVVVVLERPRISRSALSLSFCAVVVGVVGGVVLAAQILKILSNGHTCQKNVRSFVTHFFRNFLNLFFFPSSLIASHMRYMSSQPRTTLF
jgi:hypothetical protein